MTEWLWIISAVVVMSCTTTLPTPIPDNQVNYLVKIEAIDKTTGKSLTLKRAIIHTYGVDGVPNSHLSELTNAGEQKHNVLTFKGHDSKSRYTAYAFVPGYELQTIRGSYPDVAGAKQITHTIKLALERCKRCSYANGRQRNTEANTQTMYGYLVDPENLEALFNEGVRLRADADFAIVLDLLFEKTAELPAKRQSIAKLIRIDPNIKWYREQYGSDPNAMRWFPKSSQTDMCVPDYSGVDTATSLGGRCRPKGGQCPPQFKIAKTVFPLAKNEVCAINPKSDEG